MALLNDLSAGVETLVVEMRMLRRRGELAIDDIWKAILQLQLCWQTRSAWALCEGWVRGRHSR